MSNLYRLVLAFLDKFPTTCFVTKTTHIIIIELVSAELLRKVTENS